MSGFRLTGSAALGRGLQAMIAAVADHMRQRILDQFQHLPIEFGLRAVQDQFDPLVEIASEVADQPGQLVPGIADRLHAGLHHAFLQIGGDVRQPLQRHVEFAVVLHAGQLQELIAGQHKLADQGHQAFEHVHTDPDGLHRGHRFSRRGLRGSDFPRNEFW